MPHKKMLLSASDLAKLRHCGYFFRLMTIFWVPKCTQAKWLLNWLIFDIHFGEFSIKPSGSTAWQLLR